MVLSLLVTDIISNENKSTGLYNWHRRVPANGGASSQVAQPIGSCTNQGSTLRVLCVLTVCLSAEWTGLCLVTRLSILSLLDIRANLDCKVPARAYSLQNATTESIMPWS